MSAGRDFMNPEWVDKVMAQVLGHKTTQSTRRYAHLYPEAQVAALATIFRRKA